MRRGLRVRTILLGLGVLGLASPARAIGPDFTDEILVARRMPGEAGIEVISDCRIDRDYRTQGWFGSEVEVGILRGWILEGGAAALNRGKGLELATWKMESRYVLGQQPEWPVALAGSVEYEVEEPPAKHISIERMVGVHAIATRTFAGSLLATANLGFSWRLAPIKGDSLTYAFGLRYPEGRTVCYGIEYRRDPLEHLTHAGPEVRIALPRRMLLRMGGIFSKQPNVYRFIGRAILEVDL